MDVVAPAPLPKRRLPTKASSGRIVLSSPAPDSPRNGGSATAFSNDASPSSPCAVDGLGSSTCIAMQDSLTSISASSISRQQQSELDDACSMDARCGPGEGESSCSHGSSSMSTPVPQQQPALAPACGPSTSSPCPAPPLPVASSSTATAAASTRSPPRWPAAPPHPRVARPPPLAAGPLNSAATPHVVALPVKRRGSYQSLKRHVTPTLGIESEEKPSIMNLIKKATHWERFGTILVLGCMHGDSASPVMQMLLAEGYDTNQVSSYSEAVEAFASAEVFPDVVLVDCDVTTYLPLQLISHLQSQNAAVAIICIGSPGSKPDSVAALQAGAADFVQRPLDLGELVARIERHVQRQHCIKLELETAMEGARSMMAQLSTATALGDALTRRSCGGSGSLRPGGGRLIAVAETDFEQQITDLSDENQRLGNKLSELEQRLERKVLENTLLMEKLSAMECRLSAESKGVSGQLTMMVEQNSTIINKVDALERYMRHSQELSRTMDSSDAIPELEPSAETMEG